MAPSFAGAVTKDVDEEDAFDLADDAGRDFSGWKGWGWAARDFHEVLSESAAVHAGETRKLMEGHAGHRVPGRSSGLGPSLWSCVPVVSRPTTERPHSYKGEGAPLGVAVVSAELITALLKRDELDEPAGEVAGVIAKPSFEVP